MATERLDANDLDGGGTAIEEALKLSPDSAEALALKTRLDAARAAAVPPAPPVDPTVTAGPPPIPDWPPSWPKLQRRDRESPAAYIKRGLGLKGKYQLADGQFERGEMAAAAASFEAVLADEPGFHKAPQKLQRARQALQAAQARDEAQRAFEAGRGREEKGDIGAAVTQYQRAVDADPRWKDAADSVERLRTYINQTVPTLMSRAKGAAAYRDPKTAETVYEQVLKLLPETDSRRREVEQELKKLRGGSL